MPCESPFVYVGALAPEYLSVTVERDGNSYISDLTTVTSAVLVVRKPDGTTVTWAVTLNNQTTGSVELRHVYAAGDISMPGTYTVLAKLTTGAGVYPADAVNFLAVEFWT